MDDFRRRYYEIVKPKLRAIIKIEKDNVTILDEIRKKGLEIRRTGPRWFTIEGNSKLVKSVEDMNGVEKFALDQVFCQF